MNKQTSGLCLLFIGIMTGVLGTMTSIWICQKAVTPYQNLVTLDNSVRKSLENYNPIQQRYLGNRYRKVSDEMYDLVDEISTYDTRRTK